MTVLYALLLALTTVAQAQLIPTGQEIVYSYHGHVQNSVEDPTLFTSEYFINAQVHIKGFNNGSLISLHELTYSTYLGKGKLEDETNPQPIPPETKCLQLPFFVQYTLDGKVLNVLTEIEDPQWSVNMKQAIASLLQLDYLQMDLTKTKPYSFNSDEQLVYGHCKIQYDIVPHNKTSSTIRKWVSSCKDRKWQMNFNVVSPGHCEASFDNSIQQNSYRTYDVEWTNKAFTINRIESDGTTLFYPVGGKGGAHSVHVKQIMKILNVSPMNNVGFENLISNGVKIQLYKPSAIPGSFPDMTLGRSKVDLHNVMPKMRIALQRVVDHLKTSHVTLKEPDWTKGQTIQELLSFLRLFDVESLNHCYKIISGTTDKHDQAVLDVFYQILPFVGTHASNIFIKDIIKSKSVDVGIAVKLLQQLAFHTQFPDDVLLKELFEFSTWGSDVNQEVRGAAILCFSTLVSRVLKSHPDNSEVNGYVNYFIEEFKTAKEYYDQMLYISALQNLESLKVTKFLEPLIMNHKTPIYKVTPQLRNLAIWAARSVHLKHPEMAHGIYWPILVNDKEPLEIRTSALSVLMANPSMSSQMKIYWFMMTESDNHLYNVYYTTLKTLAASVSPCYQVSSSNSKRILHYIRRPANMTTESSVYQYDYYDSGFNMGSVIRASQVGNLMTHLSTALYVQLSSHVSNLMVNRYSTYIKLTISKRLREILQSKMKAATVDTILSNELHKVIVEPNSGVKTEDFHLEYITLHRNHIVSLYYYNEPGKLMQFLNDIKNFAEPNSTIKYDIAQAVEGRVLLATDIGIPTYVYVSTPSVQKLSWLYMPETLDFIENLKIRLDLVEWNYQMYGISVFDPIANSWHGSRRFLTVDQYLPISLDLSINTQQKTVKLSFNTIPSKDMVTDHFGFQAFVQSQVYQYDMDKLKFIHYERVSKGMEHRNEHVVMDRELEDIGLHLKVAIFDCERPITPSRLIHLQREFLSNYNKNWGDLPVLKMLLALRHWWAYVTLSANPGMCGMGIRFSPSIDSPATHADLTLRLVMGDVNVNTSTINFRSTYNLKNVDKVIKGWDINILSDVTRNHIDNAAITVSRMKPGLPDYKLCINGRNERKEESISGFWNFLGGEAVNNKCPHNEMKIDVTTKNELSSEQLQEEQGKLPIYRQCHPDTYNLFQCMMAQSSLRHYEYDTKYTNVPQEYLHMWIHFKDWLRAEYGHHFVRVFDEDKTTKEGHIKMVLDYPVATEDLNLSIHTPNGCHKYEGIPLSNWFWTGMVHPYSTLVSDIHRMSEGLGMTYICQITPDSFVDQFNTQVEYHVPQEWTLYASGKRSDPKWKIYVKKVNETYPLALRVEAFGNHLDIHIHGDFQFSLNDEKLPALQYGYRSSSWFDYKVHRQEHKVTLLLHDGGIGINLDYDGNKVNIHLVEGKPFSGLCYEPPMTNSELEN